MNRYRFVAQRPLQLIPVLIGISLITFFLIAAIPGDPVTNMLGTKADAETVAKIRAHYGLDQPLWRQYFTYMINLVQGDLGQSIIHKIPVFELTKNRIAPTLFLLIYSILISILIAVPLAVLAAVNKGRWVDQLIRGFTTLTLGIPSFWLGIMLIIMFSVWIPLFPVGGYGESFIDHLYYLFLPAVTIASGLSTILIRTLRGNIIETLNADYIIGSHAKGLSSRSIFWRHAMRNSLIPTVNLLGVNIGWLIGGSVMVEIVFTVPGLGRLMYESIIARDYFVVQSLALIFACSTILVTFIVDIITVSLDPRVET